MSSPPLTSQDHGAQIGPQFLAFDAGHGHLRDQCVEESDLFPLYGYFKRCPADAFPEPRVKP